MSPSPENSVIHPPKLGMIGSLLVRYKETEDGEIPVLFRPRPSSLARKPLTCCIPRTFVKPVVCEIRRCSKRWRGSANSDYYTPPVKRVRVPQQPVSRVPTTPTKASSGGEPAQPEEEAVHPDFVNVIRDLENRLADLERDVNEREVRNVIETPGQAEKCVELASWQMGDSILREFHRILLEELSSESVAKEILFNICMMRGSSSPEQRDLLRRNKESLIRELAASEARLERFKEIAEQTRIRGKLAMQLLLGVPHEV